MKIDIWFTKYEEGTTPDKSLGHIVERKTIDLKSDDAQEYVDEVKRKLQDGYQVSMKIV